MKITDIKPYAILLGGKVQVLVKVETDAGLYGWGEAGISGSGRGIAGVVRHYREWLIGRDPLQRGALWQEMYRSQYFEGGRVLTAAISAIDVALHDIVGKAWGVPVYQLLGGKHRDRVQGFATTGGDTPGALLENVQRLLAQGWTALRLSPGRGGEGDSYEPRVSMAATAERVIHVREAVGHEPALGVDYHHRLSVAEAASFCQMLPAHTLDFLEEPIRDETPEAYEALRRMTSMPFAIGEEFASKWQFLPYIERGITNYARLDLANVGGFSEAMKVAGWCEAHYIDLMPHNPLGAVNTAASVHLCAAVPNLSWLEVNIGQTEDPGARFDSHVFPQQVRREGPWYAVPDGPGLGIEVNEAALAAEAPLAIVSHLRRADGSLTNR